MATLKKKISDSQVEEEMIESVNEEELEVLETSYQNGSDVNKKKTERVIEFLEEKFNLKGKNYFLIGYADKGNKVVTTLANDDTEIQVTIKSPDLIYSLSQEV